MTIGYDAFLSRAAEAMQQSPIRQAPGRVAQPRAATIGTTISVLAHCALMPASARERARRRRAAD